ncbi:MAG: hypothetical protein AAF447_10375 [Myxococcota bacterium]
MTALQKAPTYTHSGQATPLGLVLGFVAIGVSPLLGALYAAAIFYIPLIYLNAILTAVFGALLGFAIAQALRAGKVRSTLLTLAFVGVGTLVAYYVHWAVWLNRLSEGELSVLDALVPDVMFGFIGEVYELGAWSLFGSEVSGLALGAVWLVELLLIFGLSLLVGYVVSVGDPFCEHCGTWCKEHKGVLALDDAPDTSAFEARIAAADLAALRELPRARPGEATWLEVDLFRCPGCGKTNTLDLHHVTLSLDDKGNEQRKEDTRVRGLLLTPEQTEWVSAVGAEATSPAATSPAPPSP